MTASRPILRILIVEDDSDRLQLLQSWLPEIVRTVVATSAGKAMGVLQRDRGNVYAGILLDHDLQLQVAAESDRYLSGGSVVDAIIKYVSKDVPILVHSMNVFQAPVMMARLEQAGFPVTRIPMEQLSQEKLAAWLQEVREIWEESNSE